MTAELVTFPVKTPEKDNMAHQTSQTINRVIAVAQNRKMGALWITLTVITCLSWTAWNLMNFQTSMQINAYGIQQQLKLESEIQQLTEYRETNSNDTIERRIKQAETQIFNDYKALAEWLYTLTIQSKKKGLTVKYKLGIETEEKSLADILSIPIEIEVIAANNKTNVYLIYQRLLDFMKSLLSQSWHQELQQAGIENQGVEKARLILLLKIRMWKPELFTPQEYDVSDLLEMGSDTLPMDTP